MPSPPTRSFVHLALVFANSCFGLGSIIGTVGISGMNPFQFSLLRVLVAGSLMLLVSVMVKSCKRIQHHPPTSNEKERLLTATSIEEVNYHRILKHGRGLYEEEYEQNYYQWIPQTKQDWRLFWAFGFLVSLGMSGYLCGLHLAGPIAGSIWQPSMPIWTVAICMVWKLEPVQTWRVVGVFVAFGGYVGMILLMDHDNDPGNVQEQPMEENDVPAVQQFNSSSVMFLFGNCLFFLACLAGSCSVLLSKKLLKVYPPLTVTAWSFLLSSPFLLVATIASSSIPSWQLLVCPDCSEWDGSIGSLLHIPREALPAFLYYVVFMSMVAWGLILWANQHVTGTFVVGYSVVQPITSSVFVVLLLAMNWIPNCQDDDEIEHPKGDICLDHPGVGALAGMIGILVGLALIVKTEPKRDEPRHPQWQNLKVLSIETNFAETHNAIYGSMVANGSTSLLRP